MLTYFRILDLSWRRDEIVLKRNYTRDKGRSWWSMVWIDSINTLTEWNGEWSRSSEISSQEHLGLDLTFLKQFVIKAKWIQMSLLEYETWSLIEILDIELQDLIYCYRSQIINWVCMLGSTGIFILKFIYGYCGNMYYNLLDFHSHFEWF